MMIRYPFYLVLYLAMQVITYILTPLLPLFAVQAIGFSQNGKIWRTGWRLPRWLAWFDTPDNDLDGDANHLNKYLAYPRYLRHLFWLYRNSLYGFKWTVLAAPIEVDFRLYEGDTVKINYKTKVFGTFFIKQENGYWQWKSVQPSKWFPGRIWVLNFGWLLDDTDKRLGLFMFSPRLK